MPWIGAKQDHRHRCRLPGRIRLLWRQGRTLWGCPECLTVWERHDDPTVLWHTRKDLILHPTKRVATHNLRAQHDPPAPPAPRI